jgi:HAD superfamily hydrolase (TIGR01509 family)
MSAPRAVFFDFAGTLFSARSLRDGHLEQLRLVGDAVGVTASDDELRAAYRRGLSDAYREVATRPYYLHRELFGRAFVEMARTLGGALAPASIADLVDRQYRATLDTAMLRDDCVATLRNLRAKGVGVQIVSNIDDDQMDALAARLALAPEVDAWTSSESARSCKPDARIYQVALEVAGCDAADVLFVGDSPAHDVVGPRALGMATALLVADARPGAPDGSPDFVIERLGQVVEIVERESVG